MVDRNSAPKLKAPWPQRFNWLAGALAALVAAALGIFQLMRPNEPPRPPTGPDSSRADGRGGEPPICAKRLQGPYRGAPVISLSPSSGQVGTTVTVSGENFGRDE